MARFQSRLFNWIDRSLPAQLGKKTRTWLQQVIRPQQLSRIVHDWAVSPTQPLLLKPVQTLVLWIDRGLNRGITLGTKPKNRVKKLGNYHKSLTILGSFDQVSRFQKLIQAAIAYFRKHFKNRLKPTAAPQLPPLTMADLFGDDSSVWPPLPSTGAIRFPSPATPTNFQPPPSSRPLQAWIETRAVFLGYAYPHRFVDWLDQVVAHLENWLAWLGQALLGMIKKLWQILSN